MVTIIIIIVIIITIIIFDIWIFIIKFFSQFANINFLLKLTFRAKILQKELEEIKTQNTIQEKENGIKVINQYKTN